MQLATDIIIDEFSERYGEKAQELINALMIYINRGWNLTDAVNQALLDVGLNDFLTENIQSMIIDSAADGLDIDKTSAIPLLKPLTSDWDGSGMTLSKKLHRANRQIHESITNVIQAQLALNNHVNKISREIYDGYKSNKGVIERQSLPKYISEVITFARRSNLSDYEKRQLLELCRKTRKKIDKLSQNDAPNKALKTSYYKLIKAIESGKEHAINRAVTTAVEEKTRYVAERIARTEKARAYQDGFLKKYQNDRLVVAYKWKTASRHPVFDICDMYAKADLYGLGKGIFPKDKVPQIPVHPHCLCLLLPIYKTEVDLNKQKDNIKAGGDEWLNSIPADKRFKVLGEKGLKAWQNGDDWRKYMRNYSSEADKSRLKDLNIKSEDDIIKEKITELAKKYKIKFEQVKYPPKKLGIPFNELHFDNNHINKERNHKVTRQEAETFINEALCTLVRWNGDFLCYYSKKGAAYINIKEKSIRTAFKEIQYDENTLNFINEVKKNVKG